MENRKDRNKICAKKIKNYSFSILERGGFVKTNTYLNFFGRMIMELINDKMALLDKICIGDFKIIEIDNLLGLQKAGIVTVIESQSRYVVLDTGEYFSKLQIDKTEFFDSFIVGTGKGNRFSYGRMEMSIRDENFHNLNCYTVKQYLEKIEKARIFLKRNMELL